MIRRETIASISSGSTMRQIIALIRHRPNDVLTRSGRLNIVNICKLIGKPRDMVELAIEDVKAHRHAN